MELSGERPKRSPGEPFPSDGHLVPSAKQEVRATTEAEASDPNQRAQPREVLTPAGLRGQRLKCRRDAQDRKVSPL